MPTHQSVGVGVGVWALTSVREVVEVADQCGVTRLQIFGALR